MRSAARFQMLWCGTPARSTPTKPRDRARPSSSSRGRRRPLERAVPFREEGCVVSASFPVEANIHGPSPLGEIKMVEAGFKPKEWMIMSLNVPEKWEPFIRSKMQSGRYRSEEEILDEALCLLKQRDSEHAEEKNRIEALLLEG